MNNYTFRTYRDGDAGQLSMLFDQFQDELLELDPLHRLQRHTGYGVATLAETLADISQHEGVWYMVSDNDQIIAFAVGTIQRPTHQEALSLIPSSRGRVTELYVHPSYRRQGIATRLVHAVERYCVEHDCDVVRIEVFVPNQPAREFYAKLGYIERDIDLIKPVARD